MRAGGTHSSSLPKKPGFVLGVSLLLLTLLSGCTLDDLKYTVKMVLQRHIDPEKLDTGLPVIKINTHNRRAVTSKEQYTTADIEIVDPRDSGNNIKTAGEIRGRGNSSWSPTVLKKPYRLKFSRKTALFGYEKAKSWVLLANDQDPTLILNSTAFELGRRFGLPFTPHYTHVELILNGRYSGSYVVTEQIQAGRGRVDIDEAAGFLVELDGHYDEEPKFKTPVLGLPVMIKHPGDLTENSGYDVVKTAIGEFEAALFADDFPDNRYRDLIDMDTFVDFILINELTRNEDLQFPHSVYLYRNGGDGARIGAGPLWDFDVAFGWTPAYFSDVTGMYGDTTFREGPGQRFFARFFEDPAFRTKYKERWNRHYPAIAGMEGFMDQMAALLEKSWRTEHYVWWWKKPAREEIERMKRWWRGRTAYLQGEINKF